MLSIQCRIWLPERTETLGQAACKTADGGAPEQELRPVRMQNGSVDDQCIGTRRLGIDPNARAVRLNRHVEEDQAPALQHIRGTRLR